jgi:hypothetical protein
MANYLPMPPYDELSRLLKYDPYVGAGTWLVSPSNRVQKGAFAGHLHHDGYIYIKHKSKQYKAHRLFWFLQTGHDPGILTIDHIDQNKSNNKFLNLRLATQSQQNCNTTKRCNNSSGHKGVHFCKKRQKYEAYIKIDKKKINLGRYKTFKEAVAARQAKELELFGEFSPLHRLNNDKLLPDHDEQQLSVFWHPSFRGRPADCKGFGQQHADSNSVPRAAGIC